MAQVQVNLNGRTYRLACGEGEETRLQLLAAHVKAKVDELSAEFGQAGEERLFLMAALLIADELFDARERMAAERDAGVDADAALAGGVVAAGPVKLRPSPR